MYRLWLGIGCLYGLTAVAMAAVAAHALPASMPPARVQMLRDAIQMQGWHALALVACGLRARRFAGWAGAAFAAGALLFCGDIDALVFADLHLSIAPAGGLMLMAGWALLGLSALRDG